MNLTKSPLFSIVIPTYNRAGLLEKTLKSFTKQTFENFEVLVIDDGGSDNSREVVERMEDARFTYYYKENAERGAARNFGARHAKGRYINFFDSDDLAYPEHLSLAAAAVERFAQPEVFALSYDIKTTEGKLIRTVRLPEPTQKHLLKGNHFSCNGVFVRKDTALQNPFCEIRALSGSEDFELWLRLAARYHWPVDTSLSHQIVDHSGRSVFNFSEEALDKRTFHIVNQLKNDQAFISAFGYRSLQLIEARMTTYAALHLVLSAKKLSGWKHFLKGVALHPAELFTRRTLAIFKHSLK